MLKELVSAADRRTMPSFLSGARSRVRSDGGVTLVELIITMVLMIVVITVLSTTFVSGTRSESNFASRVQTQSDARRALNELRNDLHCSYAVQSVAQNPVTAGNPSGLGFTLSLTEFNKTCAATVSGSGAGSQVFLAWCTLPTATNANVFNLFRAKGTCDSTGQLIVSDIVVPGSGTWPQNTAATAASGTGTPTSWNGNIFPTTPACQLAYLQTLSVDMAVNPDVVHSPNETYELKDQIALRNSTRCGTGTGALATVALSVSVARGDLTNTAIPVSGVITGSANESSPISFYRFGPQSTAPTVCTSGGTLAGTASTSGDGIYASSQNFNPTAAGNYWWYASIPADANNIAMTSVCGASMPETIVLGSPASPTLSMSTVPSSGSAGTTIAPAALVATLASSSNVTSGTITFKVFGPGAAPAAGSCAGSGTTVGTALPSGDGTWSPSSSSFTPATAGTYWWYASFNGDTFDNAAASVCGGSMPSTVVGKASPTLVAAGPAIGAAGTTILPSTITATLSGSSGATATGLITFKVFGPGAAPSPCTSGGTVVGTATPAGNGTYSSSAGYTPTTPGTYWWYATFAGDTNDNTANSACSGSMSSTVVSKASPTLTAAGPAAGSWGFAIPAASITATLASSSGATATGAINFTVFGPQASAPSPCTSGGTAVGTPVAAAGNATVTANQAYTPASAGTYWWYATFAGDANDNSATSVCSGAMSSTVVPDTFAVTVSPASPTAGTAFNATITAKLNAGTTDTTYSGVKTIVFTGPINGPNGTAPVYPATVSFTNGVGSASITLYKASVTTLTATQGAITGAATFTVQAGVRAAFVFTNCSANGGAVTNPCGASISVGNAGFANLHISVLDAWGNTATITGSALTVTLNNSAPAKFSLTGVATIAVGSSESSVVKATNLGNNNTAVISTTNAGFTQASITVQK